MNGFRHTAAFLSAIVMMTAGVAAATGEAPEKTLSDSPGVVKKVERGVVKGAKATGRGIEHAAESTARGVKRGANAVGRGVKRGAQAVGHAAERVGEKVSGSRSSSHDAGKQEDASP